MSTVEDRPGVGERYSSAMESSNLRAEADSRGDVDLLIAAGWVPDMLGASLYRLAVEFDLVRMDLRHGKNQNQTERWLVLSQLKSLRSTREELFAWACIEATKRSFMEPDGTVRILVGQALDIHLDPTCHHCEGRGFTGGGRHEQSGPQAICRPCRGTGSRRSHIGKTADQIDFAAHMLASMSEKMTVIEKMMGRFLRTRERFD
jgi:hypothetical protein